MRERARAPAKLNLRLLVHERDASGFHRIETVFCALELADEITLDLGAGRDVRLEVEGADLGPVENNLAVRAARGFLKGAGLERDLAIRLRKRIPAGGGLGGGSSDAAAVLRALDRLLPGAVEETALRELARTLGSDVPFFLEGHLLAIGAGRGDLLTPVAPLPSAPVLLAFPPFPISTPAAYDWLDQDRGEDDAPARAEAPPAPPRSWQEAARQAANDFEGPVLRRHPQLRLIRDGLTEAGASIALLSGTGSTLFGVFPDEQSLKAGMALLRARVPNARLEATRTASR